MKSYLFIDQDLETMKAALETSKSPVYARLINQCESYLNQSLPGEHPPKSTTFMGIAMANLSLAWLLSGDERYLVEAKRWIFTAVSYPHWGNAHLVDVDLSAAWILFGMGISYDWIAETLSDEDRGAMKEKIMLQGRRMYDFKVSTEGSGWSTNYWQNHNWINMTGLAAAGYALLKEEPEAQAWIDSAKENFDFVYSVLPEDGSDYEGVVYWRYGAMWLFVYAHLLKEREGINYFATCPFLKNTFYYRLYQAAPNLEEQINFGDAHDRRSGHSTAIYYKTAAEYRNGHAQKMGNLVRDVFLEREAALSQVKPGILPECFFEMVFYDETVEEKEFDDLLLTAFFEDLGLFVSRSSWDRNATLFTMKCSAPGGKKQWHWLWKLKQEKKYNCFGLSHQHPDNNSFLIHSQGKYFAIDDGYNRAVKAAHHNVVVVDGVGYEGEGQNNIWKEYSPEMKGEVQTAVLKDGLSYVVGETSAVYKKELNLESYKRHLIHTGHRWYFIFDHLRSSDEHSYTWLMHGDVFPKVSENCFRYCVGDARMDLYHFSDVSSRHEFQENTIRAVMTTQEPDKFTENPMKTLAICNREKVKDVTFSAVFVPAPQDSDPVTVERMEFSEGYGVTVSDSKRTESLIFGKTDGMDFQGRNLSKGLFLQIADKEAGSKFISLSELNRKGKQTAYKNFGGKF